jgi:hypothetical protein
MPQAPLNGASPALTQGFYLDDGRPLARLDWR